jgi:hypothetical protein
MSSCQKMRGFLSPLGQQHPGIDSGCQIGIRTATVDAEANKNAAAKLGKK